MRDNVRYRNIVQYLALAFLTVVLCGQLLHTWKDSGSAATRDENLVRDFKAFYCAGAVANAGDDPYLDAPVQRCGSRAGTPPAFTANGVFPAPLPGYDVALFRVFALMPYRTAAIVWLALSIAALSAAVLITARIGRVAPLLVFVAFALPLYFACLQWGQLPPIVVGCLAVAVLAIRERRYLLASVMCLLTTLEPHVGIPICIAMFLWIPASRVAIAVGAVVLAGISIAAFGLAENVEFVRPVLTYQALSEVPAANQFSANWVAWTLGAPEGLAVRIGSIDYAVMAVLGVYLARAVSRATGAFEAVILVPAVTVLLGGAYSHVTQISIAIAAGIMLAALLPKGRRAIWIAILLLAPLGYDVSGERLLSATHIETIVVVAVIAYAALFGIPLRARLGGAIVVTLAYCVLLVGLPHLPHDSIRTASSGAAYLHQFGPDARYAAVHWGAYLRDLPGATGSSLFIIANKVPRWVALLLMIGAIAANARRHGASGTRVGTPVMAAP